MNDMYVEEENVDKLNVRDAHIPSRAHFGKNEPLGNLASEVTPVPTKRHERPAPLLIHIGGKPVDRYRHGKSGSILQMATSVDAKLLKQTKFPAEFSQKVDMQKVNVEVMKKLDGGILLTGFSKTD